MHEIDDGGQLRDILGAGDLLGVGRFLGHATHRHFALAATDVVLYCLQASDVEQLIATHAEVTRYLGAARLRCAGQAQLRRRRPASPVSDIADPGWTRLVHPMRSRHDGC